MAVCGLRGCGGRTWILHHGDGIFARAVSGQRVLWAPLTWQFFCQAVPQVLAPHSQAVYKFKTMACGLLGQVAESAILTWGIPCFIDVTLACLLDWVQTCVLVTFSCMGSAVLGSHYPVPFRTAPSLLKG